MLVTPDFSEVSGVVPGVYTARIVEGEVTQSKAGAPMIKWAYEIFGSETKGANGQRVFDRTMLAGKGAFRLQDLYRAAMKEELKGNFDTDMLLGKEVKLTLAEGKTQDGSPSKYPEVKSVTGI
jgi:uncharacterized protein DUF669